MPPRDFTATPTLDPITDITRREILRGVLALPIIAAGISCADDDDGGDGGGRRSVEDAFGTVDVPDKPERIIAIWMHHVGNMLALDVVPVGSFYEPADFKDPGFAERLKGMASVRTADWTLDVEKALALNPDLVLEQSGLEDDPWNQEACDVAKAAMTTVCLPYRCTSEAGIKENLLELARVLGREKQANERIKEYDDRVEELRKKAKDAGFDKRPVAHIVFTSSGDTGFFVPTDRSSNAILRAVGIPMLPFQDSPDDGEVEFSFERLNSLNDAYAVVVFAEGDAKIDDLRNNEVWKVLEPVKAGRVVIVDEAWAADYMPAMMRMLDDIDTKLLPLASS